METSCCIVLKQTYLLYFILGFKHDAKEKESCIRIKNLMLPNWQQLQYVFLHLTKYLSYAIVIPLHRLLSFSLLYIARKSG
jgi:hypothetical protein